MEICFICEKNHLGTLLLPLLEREWAFSLNWKKKKASVTFYKGTWFVKCHAQYFELTDASCIEKCENPILRGFLEEKIKNADPNEGYICRTTPAKIILSAIELVCGNLNDIECVEIFATSRNSFFDNEGKIITD